MSTDNTPPDPNTPPAPPTDSLLPTGNPPAPPAPGSGDNNPPPGDPPPAPGEHDWLPEKFRVMGEDGKLDEAASTRKLAESYQALERHKGPLSAAPASPEDYKIEAPKDAEGNPIEIPGLDMAEFTADPLFKNMAAEAHKLGVTNEQLQFFVGKYLTTVPELLVANQQLELAEAREELRQLWKDDVAMQRGTTDAVRAINGFGGEADDVPGSRARLMQKYGRDPDFIAFAASVAKDMNEDRPPGGSGLAAGDLDVEALQKSEAYWNKNHPDHTATKSKVETYYAKKYGNTPRGGRAA